METKDKDTKPELYNRNFVYLQLLEKRLKKFDYIENHNINTWNNYFSSSDNSYLLEQDYSEIEHSKNYNIDDCLTKNETIILKQLLEQNIHHDKIFTPYLEKNICSDQKIYESFEKIKLRYIGFKKYYNIHEKVDDCTSLYKYKYDIYTNYDDYIYCSKSKFTGILCLHHTTLFVFEVLDNYFNKKYIFFSDFSGRFYKTNEFIKLDYVMIDNYEFKLHIVGKLNTQNNIIYIFRFLNDQDKRCFIMFKYLSASNNSLDKYFDGCHISLTLRGPIEDLYNKVSYTKSIQK